MISVQPINLSATNGTSQWGNISHGKGDKTEEAEVPTMPSEKY